MTRNPSHLIFQLISSNVWSLENTNVCLLFNMAVWKFSWKTKKMGKIRVWINVSGEMFSMDGRLFPLHSAKLWLGTNFTALTLPTATCVANGFCSLKTSKRTGKSCPFLILFILLVLIVYLQLCLRRFVYRGLFIVVCLWAWLVSYCCMYSLKKNRQNDSNECGQNIVANSVQILTNTSIVLYLQTFLCRHWSHTVFVQLRSVP